MNVSLISRRNMNKQVNCKTKQENTSSIIPFWANHQRAYRLKGKIVLLCILFLDTNNSDLYVVIKHTKSSDIFLFASCEFERYIMKNNID